MAKFCGGFKYDTTSLKLINGILCLADAQNVDPSKAVTGCGQMWDGEAFKIVKVDGYRPCVTLKDNGHDVKFVAGNCGVGLDADFFSKNGDGKMVATNGYVLTVNTTPANAAIVVMSDDGVAIQPREGGEYVLPNLDGKYSVTVSKEGYTGKSRTITNNKSQTVNVNLDEIVVLFDVSVNTASQFTGSTGEYYVGATTPTFDLEDGIDYLIQVDNGTVHHLTAQDINGNFTAKWLGETEGAIKTAANETYGQVVSNPKFDNYPFLIFVYENGGTPKTTLYSKTEGEHTLKISY